MKEIFEKYNIELEKEELEKFEIFLKIFKEKNSHLNLSAIREDYDIVEKHFIDSIMLNVFFDFWDSQNIKVADLWTWWWFPMIPLAIINPSINFYWIDSVWKKLKAIEEFKKELDLKNIFTINWRAEELWQNLDYREDFDYLVSRATAFMPTLLEYAIPLLRVWWVFIAYKLEDKLELKESKKALEKLKAKIIKIKSYEIWWQKRVFIFVEKIWENAKKYPRRVWEPLKKPII